MIDISSTDNNTIRCIHIRRRAWINGAFRRVPSVKVIEPVSMSVDDGISRMELLELQRLTTVENQLCDSKGDDNGARPSSVRYRLVDQHVTEQSEVI
jgi:hypothetical protein